MKTIYIDVLIVLNIYVNFFLVKATAKITHTPLKKWRCIASSVIGSLFSLTILLPELHPALTFSIKLFAALVITVTAFGVKGLLPSARLLVWFFLVNFIFGGVVTALYLTFRPKFMTFSNASLYIDFSLVSLIVFTAAAYFFVNVFRYFFDRGSSDKRRYRVLIRHREAFVNISAIADTGNNLVDVFSGKPVVICSRTMLKSVADFSCELSIENAHILSEKMGIRFIPYSTVGKGGLLAVFSPDEAAICDEEKGRNRPVDVMIGITEEEVPAIFNPKILC